MDAAVDVQGLHMSYGSVHAVRGLDLQVQRGAITSVLGPNGAGKTTTIETCEGFRRPQDGRVRVLGLDPVADAESLRPRVGVMLQSGGAWSGVRAGEMLRHVARLHAHPLSVPELMERLGLTASGRTPYRRMSGGMQQRLGLAMAIVGRPELVFLDEPTAGLDPQARRATWDLIRELRDGGVTVVLCTHFMDEAEMLSDQIHVVDAGRVIASGTPAELMTSGAGRTVRFGAATDLDTTDLLSRLGAEFTVTQDSPGRYVVTGDVTPALISDIARWCADHDILIESVDVERQSLEDRFLDLTGRNIR